MERVLRIGSLLFLAFMVAGCRQNQHVIAKPHGLELPALPITTGAPVFEPENGHYAELLLRDGHWHAFVDGIPVADPEDEERMHDFLKSFKDSEERQGRPPVVLISADGQSPLSRIRIPVRVMARTGIDRSQFHVRTSSYEGQESSSYHALAMEFPCPHCQLMDHNEKIKPLVIFIKENGSIQQEVDDSLTLLDDSQATSDLPDLDTRLRHYAERVRSENAAPVVSVMVNDTTPYQRFIDVMSRLQDHGLELLTSALVDWWETDNE